MSYEESKAIKQELVYFRNSTPGVHQQVQGKDYELDHIVPLELEGDNSRDNLQLSPWRVAKPDDQKENSLRREVCEGKKTLQAAQQEIVTYKRNEDR